MVNRRGESRIGCLLPILVLALAAYFAVDFGEAYFRFYEFKDAMGQEARFSSDKTDAQITTLRERLVKLAVWVERSARRIVLHLPNTCPWLATWRQLARAVGATS